VTLPKVDAMELIQTAKPFEDADCVFEVKYDGFRSLAYIENGTCKLVSRATYDDLARLTFPRLTATYGSQPLFRASTVLPASSALSRMSMHDRAVGYYGATTSTWNVPSTVCGLPSPPTT
jgi:hypothetical protein